jgi:hypothetical protein
MAEPVVALNPVFGDQVYVVAPLAVKLVLVPVQIVAELGLMLRFGKEFTATENALVFTHPFEFVPVRV